MIKREGRLQHERNRDQEELISDRLKLVYERLTGHCALVLLPLVLQWIENGDWL
jgi:hypothetical protein